MLLVSLDIIETKENGGKGERVVVAVRVVRGIAPAEARGSERTTVTMDG